MRPLVNGVVAVLTLSYPLAVYFGSHYVEPWQIAAILALLLLVRLMLVGRVNRTDSRLLMIAAIIYCGVSILSNNLITLRFYPVLINFGLLLVFSASLYFRPPVIERLARLQNPNLPPESVPYTRKVTQIWCVFFLLNGLLAAATALWCDLAIWSLYNGLIAYLLIGLLIAVEYRVRIRTQGYVR